MLRGNILRAGLAVCFVSQSGFAKTQQPVMLDRIRNKAVAVLSRDPFYSDKVDTLKVAPFRSGQAKKCGQRAFYVLKGPQEIYVCDVVGSLPEATLVKTLVEEAKKFSRGNMQLGTRGEPSEHSYPANE